MAGRLIVMKNTLNQIKGDCDATNYTDWLKLESVSFGASAYHQRDQETGSSHQTGVAIVLPFGPWIAELQQALYHGWLLGDVEIHEIDQKIDENKKKVWKRIRAIKLIGGWVESMNHGWSGITTSVEARLQYTDMEFNWADKMAVFHRSERG